MLLIVLTSLLATAFNTSSTDSTGWFVQVLQNTFSLAAFVTYEDKAAFVAGCVYVIYYCIRIQVLSYTTASGFRYLLPDSL
jgi:hypothetical protein